MSIAILYATMTGNARECAEKASAHAARAGLATQVHDLAHYDPRKLAEESTVLLAISTWGDGEPPDDAVAFFDHVKSLDPSALPHLRFAVFALGDTSYDQFCQCGKDFDRMFAERGAARILERVDNDVDYHEALEKWCENIVSVLAGPLAPQIAGAARD